MSELLTAARPYAKALYEVAGQDDAKSWLPIMQVCQALGDNEDSQLLLKGHDLTLDKFDGLLQSLFNTAGIDNVPQRFKDFTKVLSHNKRFALLPEIASLFIEEVNKSNDTLLANIVSAKPLNDAHQASLVEKLEKKFGKKVNTSIEIDESLIGGAVIRIGDTVIDGSVKGRLEQLTKALN